MTDDQRLDWLEAYISVAKFEMVTLAPMVPCQFIITVYTEPERIFMGEGLRAAIDAAAQGTETLKW